MTAVAQRLEALLTQALAPARLQIRDDSAAHAGHAGAREGAHFAVTVVAEGFAGRRPLERHRMVYDAAAPLMKQGIHALQINALTPAEAAARDSSRFDSPRSS
jgi:BolA protein